MRNRRSKETSSGDYQNKLSILDGQLANINNKIRVHQTAVARKKEPLKTYGKKNTIARSKNDSIFSSSLGSPSSSLRKQRPKPVLPPPRQPLIRPKRPKRNLALNGVQLSKSLSYCVELVDEMMYHNNAWPFNQPVDPIALGIPDYFDIIKRPMDLRTIKENLESGVYINVSNFAEDVRLVWQNALTFNPPDSEIAVMGQKMSEYFEQRYPMAEKLELQNDDDHNQFKDKKRKLREMVKELTQSLKEVRRQLEELKDDNVNNSQPERKPKVKKETKNRTTSNIKSKKSDECANQQSLYASALSYEEKNNLLQSINNINPCHLPGIVNIIEKDLPDLIKARKEAIELDMDTLSISTFRELETYVRDCMNKDNNKTITIQIEPEISTKNNSKLSSAQTQPFHTIANGENNEHNVERHSKDTNEEEDEDENENEEEVSDSDSESSDVSATSSSSSG
eukprot:TRINITY_DN755_c0_g1_i1.p1 TRINITY_DN755_c0_g1~~TRINITY_DN755_c0_g1_i1.p1  ORF type:complete len:453 (-),score=74.87 TRINITY_DN755_c0_g1_i1:156-1514(-)